MVSLIRLIRSRILKTIIKYHTKEDGNPFIYTLDPDAFALADEHDQQLKKSAEERYL